MNRIAAVVVFLIASAAFAGDVADTARYSVNAAPRVGAAPVIDGVVGKREWYGASRLPGLIEVKRGVVSDTRARVYLCHDEAALYVAFQIDRAEKARVPAAGQRGHDGDFSGDDVVEVLLDPGHGHQAAVSLGGNAAGASWDRGEGDWSPSWQYKARYDETFGWEGEMAIPFASLGRAAPAAGEVWGFDFINRQRTPAEQTSAYSFTSEGRPAGQLSHIVFVTGVPAVRFTQSGSFWNEQGGGAVIELPNLGAAAAKLDVSLELLRRKAGARGSYLTNIMAGHTDAVDIILATAKEIVAEELAKYEPAELVQTAAGAMTVAANRRGEARVTASAPAEYLLKYRVTSGGGSGGQVMAAGVLPYLLAPAMRMTVTPYFLSPGVIEVKADLRQATEWKEGASLAVQLAKVAGGVPVAEEWVPYAGARELTVTLPTGSADAGGWMVSMALVGPDRKGLGAVHAGVTKPATPGWFSERAGMTPVIPEPWTAIETSGRKVSFLMGEYALSEAGLPVQASVRTIYEETRAPLLTGPMAIKASAEGKEIAWTATGEVKSAKAEMVETVGRLASPAVTIDATTQFEFDGMAKVTLRVAPTGPGPAALDHLCLEIPLSSQVARLYQRAPTPGGMKNFMGAGAVPAEGLKHEFVFSVWLGDEERGFRWFAENMKGWHVGRKFADEAIEVITGASGTVLRINLIRDDKPVAITSPREIVFGYMFTPARTVRVKPINHGLVHDRIASTAGSRMNNGEIWFFPLQGWPIIPEPDLAKVRDAQQAKEWGVNTLEQMRNSVKMGHDMGVSVTPYSGWFIPFESPQYKLFGDEMTAQPLRSAGCGCDVVCWNTSMQDVYTSLLGDRIRDLDIDGFRLDAGFSAENCDNLIHRGYGSTCGYYDDDGKLQPSRGVFAAREAAKRAYRLFHGGLKQGGTCIQHIHQGNRYDPILVFMDAVLSVEGAEMKMKSLRDFSLDFFRANVMGDAHGWQVIYMPKTPWVGYDARMGLCLLHNYSPRGSHMIMDSLEASYSRAASSPSAVWAAREWIGPFEKGTQFVGYWKNSPLLDTGSADLKGSFHYRKGEKALLGILNLEQKPVAASVKLDLAGMGFTGKVYAYDPMERTAVVVEGDRMALTFGPESYRMVMISATPLNYYEPQVTGENLIPEVAPDKWPAQGWITRWWVDESKPRTPTNEEMRIENGRIVMVGKGNDCVQLFKQLKVEKGKSYLLEVDASLECDNGAFTGELVELNYLHVVLGEPYINDKRTLSSQTLAGRTEKIRLWFTANEYAHVDILLRQSKAKAIIHRMELRELANVPRRAWEFEP